MMNNRISEEGNNFNEKLVEQVKRHKILYDPGAEGYTNFQAQDEIWRKIASELNEDVAACKLKWKNIRSCYTRYLRHISSQSCKVTRTYYLAKRLRFLMPFCKPNSRISVETSSIDDNLLLQHETKEFESVPKTEPFHEDEGNERQLDLDMDFDEDSNEPINMNNKRQVWETNSEYEFCKKKRSSENNDEAELNFFRSLLPDIHKMTGKQKNKLKIMILGAIDSILYSEDS